MYRILICDDEPDIVNALKIYLSNPEYELYTAATGRGALALAEEKELHLILLDIMMPELDGISALVKLREQQQNVPVILLTAKSEDSDVILGLDLGADDYITKPFNPTEVAARVRSQLRRYTRLGGTPAAAGVLSVGGLTLDDGAKTVTLEGEALSLTPTEYEILKLLLSSPGKVFSPGEIYRRVWNQPSYGGENTVAVHIRHLREKIELDPASPRYIKMIWGRGYKIEKREGNEALRITNGGDLS